MKFSLQLSHKKDTNSTLLFVKSFKVSADKYKSLRVSTGISVRSDSFNPKPKNQEWITVNKHVTPAAAKVTNKRIADLHSYLSKAEASAELDGEPLTFDTIKALVELWRDGKDPGQAAEQESSQLDVLEYLAIFIPKATEKRSKHAREGERITERTVQQYKQLLSLLENFHYYTGADMDWRRIDVQWHDLFLQWGADVEKFGLQTLGKHIKSLKRVAYYAKKEGLQVHPDILEDDDFDKPTAEADDTQYFNEDELQRIIALDLSDTPKLELERDRLIIGCYTGLRISDLQRLHMGMIRENARSVKRIYITPQKTKKTKRQREIAIPILPPVQKILDARNGFPKFNHEQAFNKAMKVIAEMAGMDEVIEAGKQEKVKVKRRDKDGKAYTAEVMRKVTSKHPKHQLMSTHSCRRSFASNMYGLMPNQHIMAITRHKKEEDFLIYIQVTADEHADRFQQFYDMAMRERGL